MNVINSALFQDVDTKYLTDVKVATAFRILSSTKLAEIPAGKVESFLRKPFLLNQDYFLSDTRGRVVAFASWAFFSEKAFEDYKSDPSSIPELADWNSGFRVCITAFADPFGHRGELLLSLKCLFSVSSHKESFLPKSFRSMRRMGLFACTA